MGGYRVCDTHHRDVFEFHVHTDFTSGVPPCASGFSLRQLLAQNRACFRFFAVKCLGRKDGVAVLKIVYFWAPCAGR